MPVHEIRQDLAPRLAEPGDRSRDGCNTLAVKFSGLDHHFEIARSDYADKFSFGLPDKSLRTSWKTKFEIFHVITSYESAQAGRTGHPTSARDL